MIPKKLVLGLTWDGYPCGRRLEKIIGKDKS